jgi:hypothetical protein
MPPPPCDRHKSLEMVPLGRTLSQLDFLRRGIFDRLRFRQIGRPAQDVRHRTDLPAPPQPQKQNTR